MKQLIIAEVNTINNYFRTQGIKAKVVKAENVLNSFIRYHLMLHNSQNFSSVEKCLRELNVALNRVRAKFSVHPTVIKPIVSPTFGLEVSHPSPQKLLWLSLIHISEPTRPY